MEEVVRRFGTAQWDVVFLQEFAHVRAARRLAGKSWLCICGHRLYLNALDPTDSALLLHKRHRHRKDVKVEASARTLGISFEIQGRRLVLLSSHWPDTWKYSEDQFAEAVDGTKDVATRLILRPVEFRRFSGCGC